MTVMNPPHIPPFDSRQIVDPPSAIVVRTQSRELELTYGQDAATKQVFVLPFEFLRVYSPSAEVVGHGPGQEVLQVGKRGIGIESLEPVGQYAVKPTFTDGHASGLYSWTYLRWLADHQEVLWQDYLDRLEAAGASRDPSNDQVSSSQAASSSSSGCPSVNVERI